MDSFTCLGGTVHLVWVIDHTVALRRVSVLITINADAIMILPICYRGEGQATTGQKVRLLSVNTAMTTSTTIYIII